MTRVRAYAFLALVLLQVTVPVLASDTAGTQMPWNEPLEILLDNLSGPTAAALLLIAFVIAAFGWAFFSDNRWLYRAGIAIIVLAAVASVSTVIDTLNLGGACL
jgi:type IV secretory pathway VirB2 component (pilin)